MMALLRYFIAFLLVLSVPTQGFAASAMLLCATTHHSQEAESTARAVDHHGQHEASLAHSATESYELGHGVDHSGETCSSCDNCGGVYAVSADLQWFNTYELRDVFFNTLYKALFGPILEGLKRPPRALLA